LPCISVYTRGESLEEWTQAPRQMLVKLQVAIELVVKGKEGSELADELDDFCEQVESVISRDDSLDETVDDIILQSIEFDWEPEGEKMFSSATLMFEAKYIRGMPKDRFYQEQTDFTKATGEWNLNSEQDEADRANDTIDIPQT